jgi:hypothetical protein
MDIFRKLQAALAEDFDRLFDQAYRDLAVEIATRDGRDNDLEKKIELLRTAQRNDVPRIRDPENQVSRLQEDVPWQGMGPKDQRAVGEKLDELQETYGPDKLIKSVHEADPGNLNSDFRQALEQLECRYRALYEDARTLLRVTGSLRTQVKRSKDTVAQWQRWFSEKNSATVVERAALRNRHFDRISRTLRGPGSLTNDKLALPLPPGSTPEPCLQADAEASPESPVLNAGSSFPTVTIGENAIRQPRPPFSGHAQSGPIDSSPRVKREDDEHEGHLNMPNAPGSAPSSTQSEEPITEDSRPPYDAPFAAPTDANAWSFKKKTKAVYAEDHAQVRPLNMKLEDLSSSPLRTALQSRESNPSGTQDLDDVGSSVKTPKKQPFVVFDETTPSHRRRDQQDPRALQPKNSNRKLSNEAVLYVGSKRRKLYERGATAIPAVTEDGEDENFGHRRKRRIEVPGDGLERVPHSASRDPMAHRRLDELLEAPSPLKCQLSLQGHTQTAVTSEKRSESGGSGSPTESLKCNSPSKSPCGSHGSSGLQEQEGHITPNADNFEPKNSERLEDASESMPYRERPLDFLDLNCFKINTERNDGLDFAFNEVVRKQDQRRCLPGCMRSNCCGDKFRAMVRTGGIQLADMDRRMLEDYLGDDDISHRDQDNLLVEAKARLLADRYGRHRYTHDRHHSPPGFWRADMPSTQELARDREEAKQLEREKIKERYIEAMRPGGLWKFADEC